MPDRLSQRIPEEHQKICQQECQTECQEICKELFCRGADINLDVDADPDLKLTCTDLRLRVVNDPVGQYVVVELLLRLFVLHILWASPDYAAQPEGVTVEHRVWTSDGVAASLTSLGCLVILEAARGELEASGRGSLHGNWEIWGVSLTMQSAIEQFADMPGADVFSRGSDRGGGRGGSEEEEMRLT